jgi:hypothetical protein
VSVDSSEAEAMPGVKRVVRLDDGVRSSPTAICAHA